MDDLRSEVLIRHLAGIASPRSDEALRRWIEEDPAFAEHAARVRAAWQEASVVDEQYDPEPALTRVLARIDRGVGDTPPGPRPVARSPVRTARRRPGAAPALAPGGGASIAARPVRSARPSRLWLRWAAVAVLVAGATSWGWHVLRGPELVTRATTAGQRATLRLGDGSVVLLGPETELRFPARFRGASRDVWLRGTAYFNVTRDNRPFTVLAGGTITRVLGTRFVVRAHDNDARVEVIVEEGRVAVRRDTAPETAAAVVSQGQLARVPERGAAEVVDGADIDALLSWTEGRVVFTAQPLAEVVRELQRWYGQRIRIADPHVRERRVTLSFEDASLDEILEVLAASLALRIESEAGGIALYDATATRGR